MIEIKQTAAQHLKDVQRLWSDGDVMRFVGFPDGLYKTDEEMRDWLRWIESGRPRIDHFSVFEDGVYCGEAFYRIDQEHENSAALDIKLFAFARGRGIAAKALSYTIEEAFRNGADVVWVDPNPENEKAIALYEKLGFRRKERPEYLICEDEPFMPVYMELRKGDGAVRLTQVTEENWLEVASLSVKEHQKEYLAPAIGILARGYVYRDCNARVFVIEHDGIIVGAALVREFTDEPLGYDLQQFMIDQYFQGRGYGSAALTLILEELRKEGHYDHVEVCVKKKDAEAIHLYEKLGFTDSGYIDEDAPDSLNMICYL